MECFCLLSSSLWEPSDAAADDGWANHTDGHGLGWLFSCFPLSYISFRHFVTVFFFSPPVGSGPLGTTFGIPFWLLLDVASSTYGTSATASGLPSTVFLAASLWSVSPDSFLHFSFIRLLWSCIMILLYSKSLFSSGKVMASQKVDIPLYWQNWALLHEW